MDWMQYWDLVWVRVGVTMTGALLVAFLARVVVFRVLLHLTRSTETDLDDRIAELLRSPVTATPLLLGVLWSVAMLDLDPRVSFVLIGLAKTMLVFVWGAAAPKVGNIFLEAFAEVADRFDWIQPKTVPVLEIGLKIIVYAAVFYFALIAWRIDVTTWLASAGVIGIAVGFAAKDTLANLFSGVFILADAPYKPGDFVILDGGLRGIVTDIGIRSTRLLTRDDVEVTVPNAVIGAGRIVNETGGPHQKMRLKVRVQAAYGSDIERVREVLLGAADGVEHVATNPAPQVRFRSFGESGLDFQLRVWIEEPVFSGRVLDVLNTRVYKGFTEAGLTIPFPQRDIRVTQQ